jgi:ubiquinone biosynthesis protein Coq4
MKDFSIELIYKTIKKPYQMAFKKNTAWSLTLDDYLACPPESLGHTLGLFIKKNGYAIQPQLEEHDVYHVLTKSGTTVKEEIKMQWYLLGNGKRSPFVFMVLSATVFYATFYAEFIQAYKKGKKAHHFHSLDFSKLLPYPLQTLLFTFNIT